MTFSASLRDANIHCFDKCEQVKSCFKLINSFMSKILIIQAPTNGKDSLNIQEVESFLNLLLFSMLLMLNCLTPIHQYLIYP